MHHVHHMINHWALLVSALFLWLLGALWYSPLLFARPWIAIVGRKEGEKPKGLVKGMVSSFVGDLILAFALAHVVFWAGATTIGWGVFVGFLCFLGFYLSPLYPQSIYEGRPFAYVAINGGYWLVGMTLVGGLLAVWR